MQTRKPNVLETIGIKNEWLRAKEIVKEYGIGLSTIYYWRDKGLIKVWKKVSPRVTVYSRRELDRLFRPIEEAQPVKNIKKTKILLSEQKKRLNKSVKSDEEFVAEYLKKQEAKKLQEKSLLEEESWDDISEDKKPRRRKKRTSKNADIKENVFVKNKVLIKKTTAPIRRLSKSDGTSRPKGLKKRGYSK